LLRGLSFPPRPVDELISPCGLQALPECTHPNAQGTGHKTEQKLLPSKNCRRIAIDEIKEVLSRMGLHKTLCSLTPQQSTKPSNIESCEHYHPADAEIPFDWILGEFTGRRNAVEFVLTERVRCPNCKHQINEKTLVEPKD